MASLKRISNLESRILEKNPRVPKFVILHSRFASWRRGFTLIELLIGIGVTVIIVFILAGVTQDTFEHLEREQERQALLDETRRSVDQISNAVQAANSVLVSYTDSQLATYTTDSDTLVLSTPAVNENGEQLTGISDTLIIDRDTVEPNQLTFIVYPGLNSAAVASNRSPTQRVTEFAIRYFTPDINQDGLDEEILDYNQVTNATRVQAELTTTQTLRDQTLVQTLVGGARLRNKSLN